MYESNSRVDKRISEIGRRYGGKGVREMDWDRDREIKDR